MPDVIKDEPPTNACTAVVGLQWGDEGKGKVVDMLSAAHDASVRYNGGANAGHSVVVGGERYALHLIPSGILAKGKLAVVGNGVVVDPAKLLEECEGLAKRGVDLSGLVISSRAHVVLPYHKVEDALREELMSAEQSAGTGAGQIGTTRRGIGPAYADKIQRATALRVGDLLDASLVRERVAVACRLKNAMLAGLSTDFKPFDAHEIAEQAIAWGEALRARIADTTYLLHEMLAQGKRLLFEGANATLLDVDHGTYPFVTSSNCAVAGISSGTGVPPSRISRVVGVAKAYSTRVGSGPMPTELFDEIGSGIRTRGREFGTTTGRPRRVGWLDLVALRYAVMINGVTEIALTLTDVLSGMPEVKVCKAYQTKNGPTDRFLPDGAALSQAVPIYETLPGIEPGLSEIRSFEQLPPNAARFVSYIESYVGAPITIVGVGPGREQSLIRPTLA